MSYLSFSLKGVAVAAIAVGMSASVALADVVKYTGAGVSPAGVLSNITGGGLGVGGINTTAGQIVLSGVTIDSGSGFVGSPNLATWCIDIFNNLAAPGTYTTGLLTASLALTIEKLIVGGNAYAGGLAVANNNAATQIAIWKAVFGNTVVSNNATINSRANDYLTYAAGNLNGFVDLANFHVETLNPSPSGSTQRLATLRPGAGPAVPTPEPASLLLISVGLLGLAGARRLRARG